jgi:hypothetical protein
MTPVFSFNAGSPKNSDRGAVSNWEQIPRVIRVDNFG